MLHLRMIKDKYIELYKEFISQLHNYAQAIRIGIRISTNFVSYTIKTEKNLALVKKTLIKTNPRL